jgi:hypothetical protein
MVRFSKPLSTLLSICLLTALGSESLPARAAPPPALRRQDDKAQKKEQKRERRQERRARRAQGGDGAQQVQEQPASQANGSAPSGDRIEVVADRESKVGDTVIHEGYVNVTLGELRLQADRVSYNTVTGDMVAEGNVIFDQGADQRVAARRAEINWNTRRGVFWETTGFTNRTQTGEYVFFTAERVIKSGPDTYELYGATVTACEDVVPKWSFSARRAELKMDDRIKLYNSVFRVKGLPAFVLPFAWIPSTKSERKSGFLLPTTGTSNQKGRTLKFAYYQTLGQSADITFRNDLYTKRGIGMGAEFRAQTDERSYMRLGSFTVKDRLFGEAGEDQGGTAFVAEAVQYLPHGWLAVGNVSLVSSLRFRQVFSDDISQVVDPRRESTFYATNNAGPFSLGLLAANQTTRLFDPARDSSEAEPAEGTDFDIKIRQAPQADLTLYPRRIFDRLPIYFSFDSSIGALKREETVEGETVLVTPAAVQRFDFQPKLTVPLATFAGIAITPSLLLRETFYTSSVDPSIPVFDPERFATTPADPRLDPTRPEFNPDLKLFDRNLIDSIEQEGLSRHYAELAVEVRPPSLEKLYLNDDGSRRFKHVIEPYVTYRLIGGIGDEFDRIIRFDERDAVANTNEFEYAIVNRFFTTSRSSDLNRRRARRRNSPEEPDQMQPVDPGRSKRRNRDRPDDEKPEEGGEAQPAGEPPAAPAPAEAKPEVELADKEAGKEKADKKQRLATGEKAELSKGGDPGRAPRQAEPAADADTRERDQEVVGGEEEDDAEPAAATNADAPAQPYEFLSIKVAQKYFFNRDFGGALVEGRRNQFYPINMLSGYTYGGRERALSPVNVQVRYRPLSSVYADVRMDIGTEDGLVRDVTLSGGARNDKVSVSASYHLSRRIDLAPNAFEPGTFPGNQVSATLQFGDDARGLYGGSRVSYEFTDRFVTDEQISGGRLRNSRSYLGYAFDCCGIQFNYNTFKAGLRNESAFSFTFTLAGIGSFGTDQFAQVGGGRGGRRRGRRARRAADDNF